MGKIDSLKTLNEKITNIIDTKENFLYLTNKNEGDFKIEMISSRNNGDTTTTIFKAEKNQKSRIFVENQFKRIVCISGKILINIPSYKEEILLHPSDTLLIPPYTGYVIKTIEDSEIFCVFKPLSNKDVPLSEHKTIYNKL